MHAVGFMQGRLSPMVDGRIQAFPSGYWEAEFPQAERLGLSLLEWTLDKDGLRENPLLTKVGRERIEHLCRTHGLQVQSVTGDCFMQAPFHKRLGHERAELIQDLVDVVHACARAGVHYLVFPLVDGGRIEHADQLTALREGFARLESALSTSGVAILFESDFGPRDLARFIDGFPASSFGINYDIGNSASLGHDPREEIRSYGARIANVHVKDRVRGGSTVPLGQGDADFEAVFRELARAGYRGDFILQTARAMDGRHAEVLARYRDMVLEWMRREFGT